MLQPVLVRPVGDERYELIAGERRWRAAKRAGLPDDPGARARRSTTSASLEQALVENLHRAGPQPPRGGGGLPAAHRGLRPHPRATSPGGSARAGRRSRNTLRLFQLPPTIQKLVAEGQLSAGHARALLGTPDRAFQEALARRAVAEGARRCARSRRRCGPAARRRRRAPAPTADSPAPTVGRRLRPPGLLELEELLSEHLDTRVKVAMGAKRGKVVIEFATLEDLERIYRAMTTGGPSTLTSLELPRRRSTADGSRPSEARPRFIHRLWENLCKSKVQARGDARRHVEASSVDTCIDDCRDTVPWTRRCAARGGGLRARRSSDRGGDRVGFERPGPARLLSGELIRGSRSASRAGRPLPSAPDHALARAGRP